MEEIMTYALFGYICGSILFARVAAALFHQDREYEKSEDGNPGTVNAFRYGGFWCGLITLCGDLLKGFIPVFLFASTHEEEIFFMPRRAGACRAGAGTCLPALSPVSRRQRHSRVVWLSAWSDAILATVCDTGRLFPAVFLDRRHHTKFSANPGHFSVQRVHDVSSFRCMRHQSWFFVYDVHRLSASAYEQGTADEDEDRAWSQPISKAGSHFPAFFSMSIFSWINCRVSATEQTSSSSCSESAKSRNASQTEDSQIVNMLNCPSGVIWMMFR